MPILILISETPHDTYDTLVFTDVRTCSTLQDEPIVSLKVMSNSFQDLSAPQHSS
jgi:hypothetical protein